MKKLSLLFILLLSIGTILSACGGSENSTEGSSNEKERLALATGGTGGAWYPIGGGLANIANINSDTLNVSAEVSNGGVENIRLVNDGTSDFAFANTDIVYEGYEGIGTYEEDGKMDIVSMFYLYPSSFQAVVSADSGIESIGDLAGKTVAVGPPASSSELMGWEVLKMYGIEEGDIDGQTIDFAEGVNALRDGNIDAVFVMSAAPNSQIMDISTTKDIKLLPVDDKVRADITEKFAYYDETTIKAGTYEGQDQDIETLALGSTVVANSNVSEEAAYEFTKAVFENLEEVKELHSVAKDISLEDAVKMPIPFHPGALKYFEEVGIEVE